MGFLQTDLEYSYRSLRRSPALTVTIVGTLAFGIGLATTLFTLINGFFFHALPYGNAERMAKLGTFRMPPAVVREIGESLVTVDALALYEETRSVASHENNLDEIEICRFDEHLMPMLGVSPLIGALPSPSDVRSGAPIVLIAERVWTQRFGRDPDVVGRRITVDGTLRTIVGVMPARFTFEHRAEYWIPLQGSAHEPSSPLGYALVRLKSGATKADAEKELSLAAARLRATDSIAYRRFRFYLAPDMVDRGRDRPGAWNIARVILGGAVSVMLIVCTNLATVMLARGAKRRTEVAIRAALGATEAQLMRQQLLESLLVTIASGIAGVLLSIWGVKLCLRVLPVGATLPGWVSFSIDGRVLLFAVAASFFGMSLFAIGPARIAVRSDLRGVIKGTANRAVVGGDHSRSAALPIILQLALSLVLVVSAVTLTASYSAQASINPGYEIAGLYRIRIADVPGGGLRAAARWEFLERLAQSVSSTLPGSKVAFSGRRYAKSKEVVDDEVFLPNAVRATTDPNWRGASVVSEEFFESMGIPILSGRSFSAVDRASDEAAVIVSRRFSRVVWGDLNPIGQRLLLGRDRQPAEVIGVSADRRAVGLRDGGTAVVDLPELRISARQARQIGDADIFVRSPGPVVQVAPAIQKGAQSVGRGQPVIVSVLAQEEERKSSFARAIAQLAGGLALLGVCVALMGIYGVVSLDVERRMPEIGVRLALGADKADILRTVTRRALRLVTIGLSAGVLCLALASSAVMNLVVGGLTVYANAAAAACLVFAIASAIACLVPARRALEMDPAVALRMD